MEAVDELAFLINLSRLRDMVIGGDSGSGSYRY